MNEFKRGTEIRVIAHVVGLPVIKGREGTIHRAVRTRSGKKLVVDLPATEEHSRALFQISLYPHEVEVVK